MLMMLVMRPICTSAAAAVALLGSVALVGAQQMPDQSREPSTRDRGSDGKVLREPPGAQQRPGTEGAERPDKAQPKGAERPDKARPKGAERPDRDRPRGAERPDGDRPRGAGGPARENRRGAGRPDRYRRTAARG